MPGHSSAQAICTRILIRARSRTALSKRHQSTFSFFSRNQDSVTPALSTNLSSLDSKVDNSNISNSSRSSPSGLKIASSFESAAPLLTAIQNKDQDTAWMVYSVLSRAGQLSTLLPIHHSLLLRSIRPAVSYRYTKENIATLVERHEQVWAGMQQCHIQPDMNDYTARLELFVATRQYQLVDLTWTEIKEKAGSLLADGSSTRIGTGPLIQPTLYTFNLFLQSCVPRKNIGLALETITLMRRAGISPDNMSWDYVLQIHTAQKNWEAVESTFRNVFQTAAVGAPGTQQSQHSQGSSGQESMVVPLGQRVRTLHGGAILPNNNKSSKSKEKLVPTLQNIHSLFSYYAYTQDLEDLRNMFDSHVRLFGLVPTTRSYNEMIKFAFLARHDGEGLDLFRELVQIGQNLEKIQAQNQHQRQQQQLKNDSELNQDSIDPTSESDSRIEAHQNSELPKMQACGPDFNTFKILINNELIASRNRWGRAWKWIKIMQEAYGLEPSDAMFRRTLASMARRGGEESDIQALQSNWDQVRARRESRRAESLSQTPSSTEGAIEELSHAASSS
ncbi:hypothetical protein BGZ46_007723 [Entomortierella lignicola]|nr:hypothetical protein BGZ46_007723 [Entomortierella lignicola]